MKLDLKGLSFRKKLMFMSFTPARSTIREIKKAEILYEGQLKTIPMPW